MDAAGIALFDLSGDRACRNAEPAREFAGVPGTRELQEGERIADGIGRTVVRNLKVMARMGVYFEDEVQRRYPEFPTRRGEWSWEDYLPPMSAGLCGLAEAYS